MKLHDIVPGVFAWVQPDGTWWVNNAGAVVGDGEVFVIDTCASEARTRRFLNAVAEATGGAPVRMAVNTHQHGDHSYGNSLLPEETVIFGHVATRAALVADPYIDGCPPVWSPVPNWGNVTRRPPSAVFEDEMTVHLGERRIELRHPGHSAHTPGDVVAWLPEERVLFAGDLLFNGLTPMLLMGSVEGALRSLEWLADFEPEHVVPGHGPLASAGDLPEVLAAHERYYRFVLAVARKGREKGLAPLDAAREADLGEFAAWADAERLVLNLHRAYAEADGGEVNVIAAFADALTWHGGPLPTSL
ncbi:cyclase [Thermocatellispora tengchongensis]|uniref:Cyclase n=1 Tax=Thermocatellispora tengchongensis TaxID=1073253 RepID=A0A840P4A8_9ACTN|nr:MBL fold metallo-hydrolase [Thermocatellispora tengchongensis]MBB5136134.1 cyclase [Thermocatellispora tengchongensis]